MDILIKAGQLILSLAILVTLHELGHFLAARAFGIKVEKFYLFFDAWGVKLFSFKRGETEYGIGWLPLGGYVKIAGMIDESLDTTQLKSEPQPWEFRSKPAWQRLIVMIGGVTVNAILGILIFTLLIFNYGKEYLPIENAKYGIVASDLAEKIGFKDGDKVLEVNGEKVEKFKDIVSPRHYIKENAIYKVQRDGQIVSIVLPSGFVDSIAENKANFIYPREKFHVDSVEKNANGKSAPLKKYDRIVKVNDTAVEYFDEFKARLANVKNADIPLTVLRGNDTVQLTANVDENGAIGFRIKGDLETKTEHFSFTQSISEGWDQALENLSLNLSVFGKIFKGEVNASKAVSGPIGIAGLFSSEWDWQQFWQLTGLLSIILAFMNILPIPALDGGHVLFLLVEMIIGRPLPDKFMHVMQVIGMILLLGLMVFAFGNDFYKLLK